MTTTIDNALHTLLGNVEEMGLPEGDYLNLTNILKKVFDENKKKPSVVNIIKPTDPIVFKLTKCLMKHIEIEIEIKEGTKTKQESGATRTILRYEVRTKNTKTGNVVVRQEEVLLHKIYNEKGVDFEDKFRHIILRYHPLNVEFSMEGIDTEYSLKDFKEHEEAEDSAIFEEDNDFDYSYETLFGHCLINQLMKSINYWVSSC